MSKVVKQNARLATSNITSIHKTSTVPYKIIASIKQLDRNVRIKGKLDSRLTQLFYPSLTPLNLDKFLCQNMQALRQGQLLPQIVPNRRTKGSFFFAVFFFLEGGRVGLLPRQIISLLAGNVSMVITGQIEFNLKKQDTI